MRALALLLLIPLAAPPPADIDVGVPPGTPLEWDKDMHQPTPSFGRRGVPTVAKPQPSPDPSKPPKPPGGMTVADRPPEPYAYGATNLYGYFGITTVDIMVHIKVELPMGGLTTKEEVGDGTGVKWIYPPYTTTETAWIGAAGCLRAFLHPEVVSVPESVAYLCEIGEPALIAAESLKGPVGERLKKLITPVPEQLPRIKTGGTPLESMIHRLATVELTSGFPSSLDPSYARRTLALGDDAYKVVAELTKSDHRFLARNAVAVLANFRNPESMEVLRKIWSSGSDPVMRYRALSGLVRRKDRAAVPLLTSKLSDSDEVARAAAAYALGMIGDPKALPGLMNAARGTSDRDYLWSLLPAIARLASTKEHADFFKAMEAKIPGLPALVRPEEAANDLLNDRPMFPPKPEPANTKLEVLKDMCLLGRVAGGDEEATKVALERFTTKGMDGFHRATWYLACDVAVRIGKPVAVPMRGFFTARVEPAVQIQALIRLAEIGVDSSFVKELAASAAQPSVQALALMMLAFRDEAAFKEIGLQVVRNYTGTSPGRAFVVGVVLQELSKLPTGNGNSLELLIRTAEKALEAKEWAWRKDDSEPDITKAKIEFHPPLLEVAAIELGRLGDPGAVPTLVKILRSGAGGGRAEACLALGALGGPEASQAVIAALEDPKDGWVRYNAWVAAKKLSGIDASVDWIFGSAADRGKAVAKYKEWLATQPK